MRLLRQISDLESRHAERRAERERALGPRIGIVWGTASQLLDVGRDLLPGEYIAMDVYITGAIARGAVDEVPTWRTVERVSTDVSDLGRVHDESGAVVGHVRSIDRGVVEWERVDAAATPREGAKSSRRRAQRDRDASRVPADPSSSPSAG